jgi:archaellum biogenesis ATPase FlaH
MTDSTNRQIVKPRLVKKNSGNIPKALQRPVREKPGKNDSNKLNPLLSLSSPDERDDNKILPIPASSSPQSEDSNKLNPLVSLSSLDKIDDGNKIQHSPEPLQDQPFNDIAFPSVVLPDTSDVKSEISPPQESSDTPKNNDCTYNSLVSLHPPHHELPDKQDDNKVPPPSVSSSDDEGNKNELIPLAVPLPLDKVSDDNKKLPLLMSSSSSVFPKRTPFCTLKDVKDLDKNIQFIGGLFPKGMLSLVIGGAGLGKSWTTQGGVLSITDGKKFLNTDNYQSVDTETVVIIDTEGRIEIFKQRILALGGTLEKFLIPGEEPTRIFSFHSQEDRKLIEDCINEHRPAALIVDSFAAFSTVDENTSAVLPCLKWMKEMALKYNIASITTQLVNKSEQKGGKLTKDSVRGFSGINQIPELIYAIDVHPDNSNFMRLYQVKNTLGQRDETEYFFYIGDAGIVFVNEVSTGSVKISNRQQILESNKDKSNSEIAKILQDAEPMLKWSAAIKAVERFRKDGERRRQGEEQV